ncbi:hypothetical protein BDDG_11777 [Blastomyces dermatitidis ATCC 18188]|uniref:Uncharacterized protein n=1 Tax=Ajellomyces dermatitidis (strain ATCC 18188 / CBS 674.68) TaxID=653446 RepID=A0A0J9ENQ0_AJEDA|nr:hypothetical protein BDDG_11777 [Blastomyces dermatitidis ATCC 18188]
MVLLPLCGCGHTSGLAGLTLEPHIFINRGKALDWTLDRSLQTHSSHRYSEEPLHLVFHIFAACYAFVVVCHRMFAIGGHRKLKRSQLFLNSPIQSDVIRLSQIGFRDIN